MSSPSADSLGPLSALDPLVALKHWQCQDPVRLAPDNGLINQTWLVGDPTVAVLQWVNPIFDPKIHLNIEVVTRHLERAGFVTPLLLPTAAGDLWADDEFGCWRLMTYVEGRTLHRLRDAAQASVAGGLVARFHAALSDWDQPFHTAPRAIHDTPARIAEMVAALEGCDGHALEAEARDLGRGVLEIWESWDGDLDLPKHMCHGDLKVSNLRFDSSGNRALCLIDFDTLEPMAYANELGDAWRSWCNPAGEDEPDDCHLDIQLFAAAARAWIAEAPPLEPRERASLVPSFERVVLELVARFTADAVRNSYFREDRERFPEPGAHNLARARGQMRLTHSVRAQRMACESILRDA